MTLLETLLLTIHALVALALCGFVLLQHGKGADMGAAFGGGASGTVFGARGSANFLSHTTAVLAAVFFVTSLGLTWYMSSRSVPKGGLMDKVPAPATKAVDVPGLPGGLGVPAADPAKGLPALPATAPANGPAGSKAGDVPK